MTKGEGEESVLATCATSWRLRTRTLRFGNCPLVIGIVNVTPDSFSDGGRFADPQRAIEHALSLIADGADLLDIGGESTRPYSEPVTIDEELRRVMPVIEKVAASTEIPISVDTSKAAVAEAALATGAEIINDVTALLGDPAMLPLAVQCGAGVCAMHMQGTPQTMQKDPRYGDVVEEVYAFLAEHRDFLEARGVDRRRICIDPGIGFGKTHEHNLSLMRHARRFLDLGCPVMIGHSRKGFLGKILGDKSAPLDAATAGAALAVATQGVHVLRVHNVRLVRDALLAFHACGGLKDAAPPVR